MNRKIMTTHNTIYIAEPIFSEKLQKCDPEITFPPIKKIGVTYDHPERRERELLGTCSPVKIAIVKAWTDVDARKIELMLHSILDNSRLDGEYFWDGNETLVEAVSEFIRVYHPEAKEIEIEDDQDVQAASEAADKKSTQRIYTKVVPKLEAMKINYKVTKNGRGIRFGLGEYRLVLSVRTAGRYTFTIWSRTKSTEEALQDFEGSQELSAQGSEDSDRRARIPMAKLETIIEAIENFKQTRLSNG
jgi:hypothetical protein